MKTVKGDLIKMAKNNEFDIIAHGCNCFHTMGAGIARQIKAEYPEAYTMDLSTLYGDIVKLGTISSVRADGQNLILVNAYTQFDFHGSVNADYAAIRSCMMKIQTLANHMNNNFMSIKVGLPLIGCGLAGGDWNIVSKIINQELSCCDLTIVEYDQGN